MSKRLIMYTNNSDRTAFWMYGPNLNNIWMVLTSADLEFDMMSQSHFLINDGGSDVDELVEATKFLVSTHGRKQAA